MGFRFYRRAKLFGGLGINFSKSGASWSVRTKAGSFSPKRASLRMGIPGLTYVVGIPRRKIIPDEGINLISIIGRVLWTCFYAFIGSAIVFVFYPQNWTAYKHLVLLYIILVPCWPIVNLIIRTITYVFGSLYDRWTTRERNVSVSHSEKIEQHISNKIHSSDNSNSISSTTNPQHYSGILSSLFSWEIPIYNLINDILDKASKFNIESIKVNELIHENPVFKEQEDCVRVILAYDIVTTSEYLDITIENESIEALIVLFSIGIITERVLCFKLTETNINAFKKYYKILLKDKERYIIPNNDNIFLSQKVYKNEPDKLLEYNNLFKQLLNFITSADSEITLREKELLNFIKTKPQETNK